MSQTWWTAAVSGLVASVAMAGVMAWLNASRGGGRREPTGAVRMEHPLAALAIVAASSLFCWGLVAVQIVIPNETVTVWTIGIFAAFGVLSLGLLAATLIDKHEVTQLGLTYSTWFGGRRFIAWDEVVRVEFAPLMHWFRVTGPPGRTARLSLMLKGLPGFAELALAHVPAARIAPTTLEILRATAAGEAPRVG